MPLANGYYAFYVRGTVKCSVTGNVIWQWACANSSGTATRGIGSYLKVKPIG